MRHALILVVLGVAAVPACRSPRLAPGLSAATPAPVAAAQPAARVNVFERFLERETKSPGLFDIDVDAVTRRILEDEERKAAGRTLGPTGGVQVVPLWGACR